MSVKIEDIPIFMFQLNVRVAVTFIEMMVESIRFKCLLLSRKPYVMDVTLATHNPRRVAVLVRLTSP